MAFSKVFLAVLVAFALMSGMTDARSLGKRADRFRNSRTAGKQLDNAQDVADKLGSNDLTSGNKVKIYTGARSNAQGAGPGRPSSNVPVITSQFSNLNGDSSFTQVLLSGESNEGGSAKASTLRNGDKTTTVMTSNSRTGSRDGQGSSEGLVLFNDEDGYGSVGQTVSNSQSGNGDYVNAIADTTTYSYSP